MDCMGGARSKRKKLTSREKCLCMHTIDKIFGGKLELLGGSFHPPPPPPPPPPPHWRLPYHNMEAGAKKWRNPGAIAHTGIRLLNIFLEDVTLLLQTRNFYMYSATGFESKMPVFVFWLVFCELQVVAG